MPFEGLYNSLLGNEAEPRRRLSSALLALTPPEESHEQLDNLASILQGMPEQEPRSFWAKLGAGLIGGAAGMTQGPQAGTQLTRSLLDMPYKSALDRWALEAKGAEGLADIESQRNQSALRGFGNEVQIAKGIDNANEAEAAALEIKRKHDADIANQEADNIRRDEEIKRSQANADRDFKLRQQTEARAARNTDSMIANRGKTQEKPKKPKTAESILKNEAASKVLAKQRLEAALGYKFKTTTNKEKGDAKYEGLSDKTKGLIDSAIREYAKILAENPEAEIPAKVLKLINDSSVKVPGFFSRATLFGDE